MPAPKDMPLTSFDPRYKELLLRGAREAFEIPCTSESEAYQLQVLICQFRNRSKKHFGEAGRSEWEPMYGCIVGKKKDDPKTLVLRPRNQQFSHVLDKIAPPTLPPPANEEPSVLTNDPLEEFEPDVEK